MGCCPSTPRERNRDAEQGWHKNTSDTHENSDRDIAELQGASPGTEPKPDTNVAELPGESTAAHPKPELDGNPVDPHHQTVFEMESPVSQRDGDTLPPPYAHSPTVENPTGFSTRSPVSPMTVIDTGSPEDEKPLR